MNRSLHTLFLIAICFSSAKPITAQDDFPIVPDDIEVSLFAKEPLVRNPCAITFDAKGRLCVGMGPQYRAPRPETPGDSVWILIDEDHDGKADTRKQFATGFNSIQGLGWKGRDLYVANAPDLTIVRDLDGDDSADEYIRLFTDLGNLEHALHGLNFGPDGKLYMSKGNAKGLTKPPDRVAPKPFRELWGTDTSILTTPPTTYNKDTYTNNYHDPADDWGITGGVLRCDPDGSNLEIVSRGFRNPWDITFDDGFDWLGTDNDQTMGDKIFAPFYGAHFGWGHAWSYDWKGDDHLPTAPSSGPLFEGSGAGVIYCGINNYPEPYRDVFFINDWLRREVYIYRPKWNGAWRLPESSPFALLAHAGGGRSMPKSTGRSFDPVDIEIGPDGAVWISSWGRQYGAHYENQKLANEGRIYRLWPKAYTPASDQDSKRSKPITEWSLDELIEGLGSHVPALRTNAQEEIIRRGEPARLPLTKLLTSQDTPKALETWAVWTLGRIDPEGTWFAKNLNQHIQSIRLQASSPNPRVEVRTSLTHSEPRIRLEAVLTIRQSKHKEWMQDLILLAAKETDRIVTYALWGALGDLLTTEERKHLLTDTRPNIRRAALLSLLEEDALTDEGLRQATKDSDHITARLAHQRLGGKDKFEHRGRPLVVETPTRPTPTSNRPAVNPFGKIKPSTGNPYRVAELRPGTPLYTDRGYRITKVPAEIAGEAFIQTANRDADPESGISVTVELKYPSTLYLIDDARAEALPKWAREGWNPTSLTLEADDPKTMRVYKRDFPAGTITLGTNRDGVKARKGNYLIVARPHLLSPGDKPATLASILPLLEKANPSRGRDLFLSRHGAHCSACHQIDNIGNNHAPDLSEIGSRGDAEFLIESIINPSASITEGFATQFVKTKPGAFHSGILLRETGQKVTLAMTGGAVVEIERDEISERKTLSSSAMPATFATLLTAPQIADITAYLLTLKSPEPVTTAEGEFRFHQNGESQLDLYFGKTKVATYLTDDPVLTRRALVNVRTPSGIPVTRPFPAPEDDDHATMHPGIWLGFGWISGNDYWRLQSKVRFDTYLVEPKADGTTATFAARNRFLSKDESEVVCTEDTHYRFQAIPEGILLDIDATYFNDERDFVFGDQEESGLAVRLAKPLTVQHGTGQITNDRREKDGAGTWGKDFKWIDYSGVAEDIRAGILIIPHPDNARNSWAHSRDYGALVANPFPKQPRQRREPYLVTPVKAGTKFQLRYRIIVHEGSAIKSLPRLAEKYSPGDSRR